MAMPGYHSPQDIPETIPVFPLPRALLLPRVDLPLNIFEPRYLQMIDDVLRGDRIVGMIQPNEATEGAEINPALYPIGCAGRLTQFSETGDGRYQVVLTGVSRFRLLEEVTADTPYRQCKVDFGAFASDLVPNLGEDEVDREALLKTLANYLAANSIDADWSGITQAPTEALVNGLSLCRRSAYGKSRRFWKRWISAHARSYWSQPPKSNWPRATVKRTEPCSRICVIAAHYPAMEKPMNTDRHTVDPKLLEILVCPLTKGPAGI